MRTLVVGAHGSLVVGVVRRLVEDGHDVAALGRRGPVELLDVSTVTDHGSSRPTGPSPDHLGFHGLQGHHSRCVRGSSGETHDG